MNAKDELRAPEQSTFEQRNLLGWQRRMLPFMARSLAALSAVFFALILYDGYQMRSLLGDDPGRSARGAVAALFAGQKDAEPTHQALLLLEAEAMDKRYRQANALLVSRMWTRQLAFMTGMILAFIGAIFILGKMSDTHATDANLGGQQFKAAISSSSPGLVMAFLGVVLIALSILVQTRIEVKDTPVYFMSLGLVNQPGLQQPKGPADDGPPARDPGLK